MGIACVGIDSKGRGHLIACFGIQGKRWRLRAERLERACSEIWSKVPPSAAVAAWVEELPPVQRKGASGRRWSEATYQGAGRQQGAALALVALVTGEDPELIRPGVWTRALSGVVVKRKVGDHTHRLRECAALITGAADALEACPRTLRIDVAEAMLIAYAAGLSLGHASPQGKQ